MNAETPAVDWEPMKAGQRVGPYRVLRELGHGGMARVYLAERADEQFEQQVALKLLRHGRATREGLRRFQQERQIVASLNHPNIARLYDGGLTAGGRPYFAMEYVDGRPIDEYCDRNRLTVDARLGLFQVVGRAVQYAHRNLLIHRDLKPANIYVTAEGQVKLLDFGIAKLLEAEVDETPVTLTGSYWMTPQYASPEQIRGQPVTTASDQYQLGLLLFELLTGRGPYRYSRHCSFVEVAETISRQEPPRPSSVVTQPIISAAVAQAPGGVSEARHTTPERLRKKLRGDLDMIVLKALRKEPEHRYASVERFVEDTECYLAGRPVQARSGNLVYRSHKFMRRHRFGVATAAAFLLLLVGYATTVTVQSRQVASERDRAQAAAARAEKVKDFLVDIFEHADPNEVVEDEITARHLLDRGAARIDEELRDRPEIQAELMHVIAKTYARLGDYDRARPLFARALEIRLELFGPENLEVAQLLNDRAMLQRFEGDYQGAEQSNRRALEVRRKLFGGDHGKVAGSLHNLARNLEVRGRYREAEELYREALAMDLRLHGRDRKGDVAYDLNGLGELLVKLGRYDEAEKYFLRALEIRREVFGDVHRTVATSLQKLALIELTKDHLAAAESLARQALDMHRRTLSVDNHYVAGDLDALGRVLLAKGDYDEAERLFGESLAIHDRLVGGEHRLAALTTSYLAGVHAARGRHAAAAALYRQALEALLRQVPEAHVEVADLSLELGRELLLLGQTEEARRRLRRSFEIRRGVFGREDPRTVEVARVLEGL